MARPVGSKNKNKRGLLGELKRQYGSNFNPIMKIGMVFPLAVLLCYLVSHFVLEKVNLKKETQVTQIS